MLTGRHGVRMQYNFIGDTAGSPGGVSAESPRWLRLTRSGDTLTGYESTDGAQWTTVGTAYLAGLPATVQVGLFVTSPCDLTVSEGSCRFTQATAVFDYISLQGEAPRSTWSRDDVGVTRNPDGTPHHPGGLDKSGSTFTVTGSGDIAPLGAQGWTIESSLIGAVAGLIVVIVVAVVFVPPQNPARRERGRGVGPGGILCGLAPFPPPLVCAGFAVLWAYPALALGLAVSVPRRRDA